ncbi:hypothetical protein Pyn_05827 [Prunus yedoensis var. nudiflora]|uniref:Uncharacterized protein n=1 Tax=Prunus yedoensis var. nudiflora TaxID=2094558 RepID=A0A314Z5D8_PRUYE|nr:hypothetical protein Pyn_05827 [Prunus yedoensis var. nudiflora]
MIDYLKQKGSLHYLCKFQIANTILYDSSDIVEPSLDQHKQVFDDDSDPEDNDLDLDDDDIDLEDGLFDDDQRVDHELMR